MARRPAEEYEPPRRQERQEDNGEINRPPPRDSSHLNGFRYSYCSSSWRSWRFDFRSPASKPDAGLRHAVLEFRSLPMPDSQTFNTFLRAYAAKLRSAD